MVSSNLFSHSEHQEPAANVVSTAQLPAMPVFSDREDSQPGADMPWSS